LGEVLLESTKIWLSAPVQEKIDCSSSPRREIGLVAGDSFPRRIERG